MKYLYSLLFGLFLSGCTLESTDYVDNGYMIISTMCNGKQSAPKLVIKRATKEEMVVILCYGFSGFNNYPNKIIELKEIQQITPKKD